MFNGKKIACVIPARLHSTRFPKKILADLHGKPLLQWVWQAARAVPFFDELIIAIDDDKTAEVIDAFGGRWVMTSKHLSSGTDRLCEIQRQGVISADVWVNWQADGPFITQQVVQDLLLSSSSDGADIWTLKKMITSIEEISSPDVVKVVCNAKHHALYFSRALIPFYRKLPESGQKVFFKHLGLYAYSDDGLKKISRLPPCDLEVVEQLEQLRFLYHGLCIVVHTTNKETLEIDLPEHLAKAHEVIKNGFFRSEKSV